MDRRRFMVHAAAVPALTLAGCRRRGIPPRPRLAEEQRNRRTGRLLDPAQWDTVEAACARLIPSDDLGPGAREARVVNYIDAQLALPEFSGLRQLFFAGLRQADALARSLASRPFADAPADKQDAVLRRLQRGVPMARRRSSNRFFRVLLTFAIEGFLCDPVYGGNHDGVGWRLVGFEPRPPRPRRPYRSPT